MAEFLLSSPADTISCLILSTNINAYQYADSAEIDEMGAAATGITFNIDKVTTMAEETEPDPDVPVGTIGTATIIGNIGARAYGALMKLQKVQKQLILTETLSTKSYGT